MDELNEILNTLIKLENLEINEEKHIKMADLWTRYYKISNLLNIKGENEELINIILENSSFIVKQDTVEKDINYELLDETIKKIKNNCGISELEAINLLNWTISNAKNNLSPILRQLGKNIESDSLSGFCEVSQALTLMPLENIGLNVTKNNATNCFNYEGNHCFGTVTFNIEENSKTYKKSYLIDFTYRQFFKTTLCNEGIYYKAGHIAPDPGYFADKDFAKELLKNGYIELNEKTAELYGMPFYKASIPMNSKIKKLNYLNNIKNGISIYSANETDLEGFNIEFKNKSR